MQTALLSLATTVAVNGATAIARQVTERSKTNIANTASNDKAVSEPASPPGFRQAFRQAMGQAKADTGAPPCEHAATTTTDQATDKATDKATEFSTEAVMPDPALAGMLSPALQALVDSLPRSASAAYLSAANVRSTATEATELSVPPALVTTLRSVAALPTDAACLAQPDPSDIATNTPRLLAKDASASAAALDFNMEKLTSDAGLAAAAATGASVSPTATVNDIASQNSSPADALLSAAAIATTHPSATSPTAATPITTRFGSAEWDKAFGQQLVWMSKTSSEGSTQSASLSLNPPELGPIKIVLHVSDTQAYASFSSAQSEVRQAIEHAMPKLREMLGESGLELAQADINSGHPQQQGDDAPHQPRQSPRSLQTADARSAARQTADGDPQAHNNVNVSTTSGSALIDLFA